MIEPMQSDRAQWVICGLGLSAFLLLALPLADTYQATSDVRLYLRYANALLASPASFPREYPPLSAALFVLPRLLSGPSALVYQLGFALFAALATWGVLRLVGRQGGSALGLLVLLLGSVGTLFFRYDVFVVWLCVGAFQACQSRRWLPAYALLGLAIALKVYPLVLVPLVASRQVQAQRSSFWPAGCGILLAGGIAGASLLLAPSQVVEMARYHSVRPLEFESVGAGLAWLVGPVSALHSFGSWNLISSAADLLIPLLAAAAPIALLGIYVLAWRRVELAPSLLWSLALLVLLLTSKVLSAQYVIWVLPFVVITLGQLPGTRWHWLPWALVALLTGLIYPFGLAHAFELRQGIMPAWLMALVLARNLSLLTGAVLLLRAALRQPAGGTGS